MVKLSSSENTVIYVCGESAPDSQQASSLLENDEVDVNGGVNLEHGDVLDGGRWAVDIDDSLVDSHLVSVPGVGSFTARRFSGGNSQDFGWNSDWTSSLVTLVLSSDEDLIASPLEWLRLSSFKGHSIVVKLQLDSFESQFLGLRRLVLLT